MINTALHSKPWYREPWPWFLISLPATAVIAGVTTVWIAATSADGLVVGDYYKAGLAINQTLARDDAARALALAATLKNEDGALTLTLAGRMKAYPEQLTLTMAHPTRQGLDQTLVFSHAGGGHYRAALPAMPAGKWHVQLADAASTWRLSGVLYTPFSQPVTLTTDAESTVQSKGD
ncbi:MAG: FixH family protein [Thiobacillus sp.]|nr:FixH family protein [Thiobacillus sp.]MDP2030377.1 FixH family protein [Thiobacillus sp.]